MLATAPPLSNRPIGRRRSRKATTTIGRVTTPPVIPGRPQQPVPTPPAKTKNATTAVVLLWIVAGILATLLCCGGVGYYLLVQGRKSGGTSSASDISVTSCTQDNGYYRASLTVKNTASRTRTIFVTVEWLDDNGGRVADTTVIVNDLAAGQESREETIAPGARQSLGVNCRVREK